jgi:hypothetical protein
MSQMPTGSRDKVYGIVAEFADPAGLIHAAEKVYHAGYRRFDCHSPFPIHGMDDAMGEKRSPVGFVVGGAALSAFVIVVLLIYWITGVDYKFVISGKPYFSFQAYVPVIFALCVLTSAVVATFSMIVLDRMPQWFHPLFESENFTRFSDDGFFVSIAAVDPQFETSATRNFLLEIGGKNIEIIDYKMLEEAEE